MTRDDEGSVMLLIMGFAAVLVGLLGVVVDVSALMLAQRSVAAVADGAALAAVQQLDESALYGGGLGDRVPLQPERVAGAVAAYAGQVQPDTTVTATVRGDGTVQVHAQRNVPLPFSRYVGLGAVTVSSVAHAQSPVLPR